MSKALVGKLNAITIYISWVFLCVLLVGLFGGALLGSSGLLKYIFIGFSGLTVFGLFHVFLSFWVKCPNCNQMLTFQGRKKPNHVVNTAINGWSYTAFTWFTGRVQCIHCGTHINTNEFRLVNKK